MNQMSPKETVLIVDDDKINIDILVAALKDSYSLSVATSGLRVFQCVERSLPDLILLDIVMPYMDGYEVCRSLKSNDKTKDIPIIFITGMTDTEDKTKGFELGAVDYITKPFEIVEVKARVRTHLALRHARAELQKINAELEVRVQERTTELSEANLLLTREIAEHKKAEEARLRLATAIEQAAESIVITDTKGIIQYVNPAVERITGYSRHELLGKPPRILDSGRHDKAFYEQLWKTLAEGRVWKGRFINRKKDGTIFEEEATISPVVDESGEIVSYVAVKHDVTERMQLERLMRQSQKMQALGTLAGGIAHDFNNILSSIIGYTDMILEDLPGDSPFMEDLKQVLDAGYRAKEMVKQILTFSRQSEEEERKPLHMGFIVKEALKLLQASLTKNIVILSNIEAERDMVLADSTQIHQILMNLCTNAGQAMGEKGGVLEIALNRVELGAGEVAAYPTLNPGPYLKLSVSDTGHGMTRAVMDRIFDPYFTTKPVGEGTGMGLSIIHGIVQNHGGAITVSSEPGRGSTFRVLLPEIESRESETVELHTAQPIPRGRNERILLVDDELPLARLWHQNLQRLGYRVASETSSVEALELFTHYPDSFDLIITDHVMPQMTGKELAGAILKIRPDIPIIVCTADNELFTSGQAQAMGIREVLMKPVSYSSLSVLIRTVLDEGLKNGSPRDSHRKELGRLL